MHHLKLVNLGREPFSNTPDPNNFYHSFGHVVCLQQIELAIRLRRGLNVVIGEVGTGKTTLCRRLIRTFADDDEVETHLILDPSFPGPLEFLANVTEMLTGSLPQGEASEQDYKEIIKQYLFRRGVDENKIVTLIVDEGQKIPEFGLEILRELLNFETNEAKLLQIVIFAQKEFAKILEGHANFSDRINCYLKLGPLDFRDARKMIAHRLETASRPQPAPKLFSFSALWTIYRITGGYPRRIVNLCHLCLLSLIVNDRQRVTRSMVLACERRQYPGKKRRRLWPVMLLAVPVLAALTIFLFRPIQPRQERSVVPVQNPAPRPRVVTAAKLIQPKVRRLESLSPTASAVSMIVGQTPPMAQTPTEERALEKPPEIIGAVVIGPGQTLYQLMRTLYTGDYKANLKKVAAANPGLVKPEQLSIGQEIRFPVIRTWTPPPGGEQWWIEIGQCRDLESALRLYKSLAKGRYEFRLIPHWDPENGLHFSVVYRRLFTSQQAALEKLVTVQSLAGGRGDAKRLKGGNSVYLTDPVF